MAGSRRSRRSVRSSTWLVARCTAATRWSPTARTARASRSRARCCDGDGDAMADALVEIWQADADGRYRHPATRRRRRATRHSTASAAPRRRRRHVRVRHDQAGPVPGQAAPCRRRTSLVSVARPRRADPLRHAALLRRTSPPTTAIRSSRSCPRAAGRRCWRGAATTAAISSTSACRGRRRRSSSMSSAGDPELFGALFGDAEVGGPSFRPRAAAGDARRRGRRWPTREADGWASCPRSCVAPIRARRARRASTTPPPSPPTRRRRAISPSRWSGS